MARLEALLSGMPGDRELRLLLEQIDPGPGGSFTWLDPRNTAITVLPASHALPVQVLLELRGRHGLGVLVTSREGMGRGAPLSHGVLEQVLGQLQALIPTSELQFRSDRDGPISRVVATTG
ncbi:MAG: hypothetical protein NTW02_04175 [Cyanobium sp. LacPavin_0920_WC12_MAG_62_9]|nr:hypothetical protein [Cyanobium sp. LacPavin_0920_WC12_MAG_62_9]